MIRMALLIALASCDAEKASEPAAPVVAPEPKKAEAKPEPPKATLGAELAVEVEKAKTRCKEGIDLAADLDGDLTGEWTGEYRYADTGRSAVPMEVTLTATAGALSGRTTEPNTLSAGVVAELGAEVRGEAFAGGRIAFMKTYDTGGLTHSILYVGQLDESRRKIEGRWRTSGITGTFTLDRAGLRG